MIELKKSSSTTASGCLENLRGSRGRENAARRQLGPTHDDLHHAHGRIRQLELELSRAQDRLRVEQSNHQDTQNLLRERAAQLHAANTFLACEDSFAVDEVIRFAEELNFDIQQLSTELTQSWGSFNLLAGWESKWEPFGAQDTLAKDIGISLRKTVEFPSISQKSIRMTWIQIVMQSVLVNLAREVLCSRCWSSDAQLDEALSVLYSSLQARSDVSTMIACKWRMLTRSVSRTPWAIQPLVDRALEKLYSVLLCFGGIDIQPLFEFDRAFRVDVERIIQSIARLDVVLHDQMSTLDIFPLVAPPGAKFDPARMVDVTSAKPSGNDEVEARVYTSVSLGLKTVDGVGMKETILLKSEVVLEQLLYATDQGVDHEEDELDVLNTGSDVKVLSKLHT